jgi:L-fuconolactonase
MIIDSQCHVSANWYEPVESLLFQMDRNKIECAVLLQMLGQTDNTYQQDCARRFLGRFVSVVLIDPAQSDACIMLSRLADGGASGVRLRPTARSAGADPLAIWRTAQDLGLPVSCVGAPATFAAPEFADLIAALPALPIVLEHLGGTNRPGADKAEETMQRAVFELARFSNVYLKVPGLGELSPRQASPTGGAIPFHPLMPSVLQQAIEQFGPSRLMWGSDFPVVSSREGYSNALSWVREALSDLPLEAQKSIFGGLASRIFGKAIR